MDQRTYIRFASLAALVLLMALALACSSARDDPLLSRRNCSPRLPCRSTRLWHPTPRLNLKPNPTPKRSLSLKPRPPVNRPTSSASTTRGKSPSLSGITLPSRWRTSSSDTSSCTAWCTRWNLVEVAEERLPVGCSQVRRRGRGARTWPGPSRRSQYRPAPGFRRSRRCRLLLRRVLRMSGLACGPS